MKTNKTLGVSLLTVAAIWCFLFVMRDIVRADCVAPPSGLVAWWPGDGNANDIIGTNNGTLLDNATANASGMVGQAFSFDGVNAVVNAGTNSFFDFSGGSADFTIEAWVKPAALPSNLSTGFASKTQGNFDGWVFGMFYDGSLFFSGCGYWEVDSRPVVLATGVWSHVAVTHTGGTYRLYCNGSQVGSGSGGTWSGSAAQLQFGRDPNRQYYNGLLDDISIYDRALSSNEIAAIYAAGSAGKCKGPSTISVAISVAMYAGLTIVGQIGDTYEIDYCNDLVASNWTVLTTMVLSNSSCLYIDTNSTFFSHRFYRAVKQ